MEKLFIASVPAFYMSCIALVHQRTIRSLYTNSAYPGGLRTFSGKILRISEDSRSLLDISRIVDYCTNHIVQ